MAETKGELPILSFSSRTAWEAWLAAQPDGAAGLWLKLPKASCGEPSVTKPEAIEVALAHGWIDGQIDRLDEDWFLTRFTPRRARSKWSANNRKTAEQLIAQGRMGPRGLAEVERAKADGRWDAAYDSHRTATVPPDLQAALDANPKAAGFFATLNSQNRYAILYRVQEPKRPETRARRIAHFVEMLADGRTFY
jgi:uncharacterized protein YdeI (YjbR/CyaY-like superfamily)